MKSSSRPFIIRCNKKKIANYISLHRRIDLTFKGLIKKSLENESIGNIFRRYSYDRFIAVWLLMQHLITK